MRQAFDHERYLQTQSEHIQGRIAQFHNKLYLEFGGKLFDDEHASRVLPGFHPDSKLQMLLKLREQVEIIITVNAKDLEANKVRGDLGIPYDQEVLRLMEAFRAVDLYVGSVVITQFAHQTAAVHFRQLLQGLDVKCYLHYPIEGYPHQVAQIVSETGLGRNEYIETQKPLVVVTAPGPGSGKMATCLSQLYHENKRGIQAGYAKFETFPIWNLPLKHPVNLAYEAATADLNDVNLLDPFHLEAYQAAAVNYNRDVEIFPVLKTILTRILGDCPYQSPTDMGVNRAGFCIQDDEAAREAGQAEILRRYYHGLCDLKLGRVTEETVKRLELLLSQADLRPEDRAVVKAAQTKADQSQTPAMAIELDEGQMVLGRTTSLLGAPAATLLNALKQLAGIQDTIPLISPHLIEPITQMKVTRLGNNNPRLHVDEALIALAISATTNPLSHLAIEQLPRLAHCEAHSTVLLDPVDLHNLRKLKLNITSDAKFKTKKRYR